MGSQFGEAGLSPCRAAWRSSIQLELRNPTWHTPEVYKLLRKHKAAFCIYELAGFRSPIEVTANFAYIRLHGPGGPYQGSYDARALNGWAQLIGQWRKTLKDIYVYFDNDQAGFAAQNALALIALL